MFAFDIDILLEEEMKPNPFFKQRHDTGFTTPNITRCQKILNHRRTTKKANKEQHDKQNDKLSTTKTMGMTMKTRIEKLKRTRK